MTNLVLKAMIWFATNCIDSPVDSRGDGMVRTNITTTYYAVVLPGHGWTTNSVTRTNICTMRLKWLAESEMVPPELPPVPAVPSWPSWETLPLNYPGWIRGIVATNLNPSLVFTNGVIYNPKTGVQITP